MESPVTQTIEQLAATSHRLATLDDFGNLARIKSRDEELAGILFQLHEHLRQLDQHTVYAQYTFDDFNVRHDIIAYSGLLTEYRQNIVEKIDFLLDIGSMREGPDKYTALFIEEKLNGIAGQCQRIDAIFDEAGLP